MFESFHFLRPWWLLALIPLTMMLWRLRYSKAASNSWRNVCDPALLNYFLVNRQPSNSRWPLSLVALAWLFTVLALAGPTWSQLPQTVYRAVHGEVIVFDLSPNMLATDITPSRLQRAKFKLMDLLNNLQADAVGLVAFSGEAYTVSPVTQDANTITAMIPEMSPNIMPTIGNNIAAGLQQGAQLLTRGGLGLNHQGGHLILITGSSADDVAIAMARDLGNQGIKIDVLAIGTDQGAPIPLASGGFLKDNSGNLAMAKMDSHSLQQLAAASGGEYIVFSNTNDDIKQVVALNNSLTTESVQSSMALANWSDQGRWLIILVLLLALLLFRRGWFEEISS